MLEAESYNPCHRKDVISQNLSSIQILANTNLENTWRHLALETIVTLAETAPAMIRKNSADMIPKISKLLNLKSEYYVIFFELGNQFSH